MKFYTEKNCVFAFFGQEKAPFRSCFVHIGVANSAGCTKKLRKSQISDFVTIFGNIWVYLSVFVPISPLFAYFIGAVCEKILVFFYFHRENCLSRFLRFPRVAYGQKDVYICANQPKTSPFSAVDNVYFRAYNTQRPNLHPRKRTPRDPCVRHRGGHISRRLLEDEGNPA